MQVIKETKFPDSNIEILDKAHSELNNQCCTNLHALCKIRIQTSSSINREARRPSQVIQSVQTHAKATGFLCEFGVVDNDDKVEKLCSGLLTNNHVIKPCMLSDHNTWKISVKVYPNNYISLTPDVMTAKFSCKFLDATFIEFNNYLVKNLKADGSYFIPIIKSSNTRQFTIPKIGSELYILQHPNSGKAAIAKGEFVGTLGVTIKHRVSTMEGSSGSPVFTDTGEVLALHIGAPNNAEFNIATAIEYIANAIIKQIEMLGPKRSDMLHLQHLNSYKLYILKKKARLIKIDDHKTRLFDARNQFLNYDNIYFKRTPHFWYWTTEDPTSQNDLLINWVQMNKNWVKSFADYPNKMPKCNEPNIMDYLTKQGDQFLHENGLNDLLDLHYMDDFLNENVIKSRELSVVRRRVSIDWTLRNSNQQEDSQQIKRNIFPTKKRKSLSLPLPPITCHTDFKNIIVEDEWPLCSLKQSTFFHSDDKNIIVEDEWPLCSPKQSTLVNIINCVTCYMQDLFYSVI